ncbi:hypothetical protein EJ05DRAFT_513804 [Pseudovirgaria hyperparasitica]|uniref:HMG box domain-containing protein n=1 Tax=Pseudovirgaria hyperparasitica TaxID=470096 RepID=A0A6A6VZY9_9PEZI|nr:uncharacterized protein EJ05DRAFT_513804 [Pseudovirgaria hyperparasitica]KAF2754887.1 hypothetical protein EJ05DRAFT_513804 [Pseudovirgaria hyperparasitica]
MSSPITRTDLRTVLNNLNLTAYYDALVSNGFDSWEGVLDITENDFHKLGFKLGHRRKLQREIETYRLRSLSLERNRRMSIAQLAMDRATGIGERTTIGLSKRGRFAHQPRPDEDAPKRPCTAYKNFQEYIHQQPQNTGKSFIEIAHITFQTWSRLSIHTRLQDWLKPASKAMEEYQMKSKEYSKTELYQSYQVYLEEYDRIHESRHSDWAQKRFDSTSSASFKRRYSATHEINTSSLLTAEDEHSIAVDESIGNLRETLDTTSQPEGQFPQKETTMLAVSAFFNGTGQRFYLWDREEAFALIEAAFGLNAQPDSWTLMDLFTIAAIGSCCDADCFPESLHIEYIQSCLQILRTCPDRRNLRAMRLFLALAFYSTLEQPHRSRMLSEAALLIGRLELQELWNTQKAHPAEENDWRKVFRSIVFMESWLHYGLGYQLRLSDKDVETGCDEIFGSDSSLEDMIQDQVNRIGLLCVRIAVDVKSHDVPNVHEIRAHMEKLEMWYRQLPAIMRIATLNSEQSEIFSHFQKRSVLLVHIMCLGAVSILHRPLLIAIARSRLAGIWDLDGSREECRVYQDYCFLAAQQAARIANLLRVDNTMPKRCWVAIFQSFSACSILLFSASQKLLYEPFGGFEQDLGYAENFIKLLAWCASSGPVAQKCLNIVTPIFQELKVISNSYWLRGDERRPSGMGSSTGTGSGNSSDHRSPGARMFGNSSCLDFPSHLPRPAAINSLADSATLFDAPPLAGISNNPPPSTPSSLSAFSPTPLGSHGSSSAASSSSMPPPPRPLQPSIDEDFVRTTRDNVKALVQRITNILLDPYMSIYGTNPMESGSTTVAAN